MLDSETREEIRRWKETLGFALLFLASKDLLGEFHKFLERTRELPVDPEAPA